MEYDKFDGEISDNDTDFTLESILAEYKGMSYIEGDKKTPKDVLDEKARRIVMEELGEVPADGDAEDENLHDASDFKEIFPDETESVIEEHRPLEKETKGDDLVISETKSDSEIETTGQKDSDVAFFENYIYSSAAPDDEIIKSVTEAIEKEAEENLKEKKRSRVRLRKDRPFPSHVDEKNAFTDEDYEQEPDYRDRARVYAKRCNSLSGKAVFALVLSIVIGIFTFVLEGGGSLPFGLGKTPVSAGGILLILQLLVMMLGLRTIINGLTDLVAGNSSAETLVAISCIVTLAAGIFNIRNGVAKVPYAAISSLSLTFAIWGERMQMQGLTDTLRRAATVAEPYSLMSEYRFDIEKSIVRKVMGRQRGFYANLEQADISEIAYRYAAPLLLLFSGVITIYGAVANKSLVTVPAMLAATCGAAASFTATLSFAVPFRSAARQQRDGGVIAGAGGVDDIFYTDGFCISDDDLYPPDTIDVGSVRILDQVPPEKAIRYTASMIVASGSCLARVFTSILANKGMSLITTQDFAAGEGGVSAVIRGEQVHTGNHAYMNLYGVRVPDELKIGNAIYTAVDGRMIAMFSVDYRPSVTVRNAIMTVLKHGVRLYLTVKDFNITPMTIEQKFKIPMEDFELLLNRSTYNSTDGSSGGGRTAAICPHGDLTETSRLISMARRIRFVSLIGTIISVASSVAGVIMMAVLSWSGSQGAADAGNLLLFMMAPLLIMILIEIFTKIWCNRRS